jgi:hypothetical protein
MKHWIWIVMAVLALPVVVFGGLGVREIYFDLQEFGIARGEGLEWSQGSSTGCGPGETATLEALLEDYPEESLEEIFGQEDPRHMVRGLFAWSRTAENNRAVAIWFQDAWHLERESHPAFNWDILAEPLPRIGLAAFLAGSDHPEAEESLAFLREMQLSDETDNRFAAVLALAQLLDRAALNEYRRITLEEDLDGWQADFLSDVQAAISYEHKSRFFEMSVASDGSIENLDWERIRKGEAGEKEVRAIFQLHDPDVMAAAIGNLWRYRDREPFVSWLRQAWALDTATQPDFNWILVENLGVRAALAGQLAKAEPSRQDDYLAFIRKVARKADPDSRHHALLALSNFDLPEDVLLFVEAFREADKGRWTSRAVDLAYHSSPKAAEAVQEFLKDETIPQAKRNVLQKVVAKRDG